MPTYFHCAGTVLEPGSIVHPGNLGRVLHQYEAPPGQGLPANVFKEGLLELSRQIYAPAKPSRLNSLFACPTLGEATRFRDKYQRTNLIYEIGPIDSNPSIHIADYEFAIAPYPQRYFQSMFDMARDYWIVPATANLEVLLLSGAH
jgi:hypothetical protein